VYLGSNASPAQLEKAIARGIESGVYTSLPNALSHVGARKAIRRT
jgi:hypothetical protein